MTYRNRLTLHSFIYPRQMAFALVGCFGLLAGAAVGSAHSGLHLNSDGDRSFSELDVNNDGKLSREEFGVDDDRTFDKLDLNDDGFVEEEEIDEYVEMKVAEVMEALDAAMVNLDQSFDVEIDFSSDRDEDWEFDVAREWDDQEFEERMEVMEERMERFGERMARVGERVGRAAARAARQATRHIDREFNRRGPMGAGPVVEEDVQAMIEERKDRVMRNLDENEDGMISRDEFPGSDRRFARMDDNEDGAISRDELRVRIRIEGGAPRMHRRVIIRSDDEDHENEDSDKGDEMLLQ